MFSVHLILYDPLDAYFALSFLNGVEGHGDGEGGDDDEGEDKHLARPFHIIVA